MLSERLMRVLRLERSLVSQIGQVWIALMLAYVLLYLFQLLVGRGLGPEQYSLFAALWGIVYLAGALSTAVGVSVAGLVVRARINGDPFRPGLIVTSSLLQVTVLGMVILLAMGLASPFLASYLHSNTIVPVVTAGALISTALLLSAIQGSLQGLERFGWYGANGVLQAGSRLFLGAAALALRFGTVGALAAVGVADLLTTLLGLGVLRPPIRASLNMASVGSTANVFLPTLAGTLAIAFPGSFDVVIVRHFFPAQEAGHYAGAALLGRVVLFLPLAVSVVLFPKYARASALGNSGRWLLYRGLGITAVISGVAALGLALLPGLALSLLLGDQYVAARSLVPLYVSAMFLFSLVVVFVYYHLATKQFSYIYFLLLPHIALGAGLIYIFHGSLSRVILVLLVVNACLVATSILFTKMVESRVPRGSTGVEVPAVGTHADS